LPVDFRYRRPLSAGVQATACRKNQQLALTDTTGKKQKKPEHQKGINPPW